MTSKTPRPVHDGAAKPTTPETCRCGRPALWSRAPSSVSGEEVRPRCPSCLLLTSSCRCAPAPTLHVRLVSAVRALRDAEAQLLGAVADLQGRSMLPTELDGLAEVLAGAEVAAAAGRERLEREALRVASLMRKGVL